MSVGGDVQAPLEASLLQAFRLRDLHSGARLGGKASWTLGLGLIVLAVLYAAVNVYTIVLAKLLPETGFPVLDFFRNDEYFCLLFALLPLPTLATVYLNWLSERLFECS